MKSLPAVGFVALLTGTSWSSRALGAPIKAAVVPSQGTQNLGLTIWRELNAGWSAYGDIPVEIDWQTLPAKGISAESLAASDADVLIISAANFDYTGDEATAIRDYVRAGHGLIITYATLDVVSLFPTVRRNADLAPLVGLSEQLSVGTNTWPDPISFDLLVPDHPIFAGLDDPYITGVPFMTSPVPPTDWQLTTGVGLARANPSVPSFTGNGLIVANETDTYRSVYFPHYLEAKNAGTNEQDRQVFYNTVVWTSQVPEPGSLSLLTVAVGGVWLARRSRRQPARWCRS